MLPTIPKKPQLVLAGSALLACCTAIAALSGGFVQGSDMADRPILAFVALMMGAALCYFAAVHGVSRCPMSRGIAWWIFLVGVGMRLLFAASHPILEDDYYRYLWDGAVTAHGHNPYGIRPADARANGEGVSESVRQLARESGIVLARVNHPELGTIYPPLAQAVFACAHWITPWRTSGLLVLYYGADCVVFALLLALLCQINRTPALVLVYWWNPLCAKEFYNSLHMDILIIPWILGALLLLWRGRPVLAATALAFATAVKLWPVLLMAPLLARLRKAPRIVLVSGAVFLLTSGLLLLPMVAARPLGNASGLAAYGTRWEMNDALFMVFPWLLGKVSFLTNLDLSARELHRGGRVIAAALVLFVVGLISRRGTVNAAPREARNRTLAGAMLWIAAALFLLSPTQFPWYFTWFAPLLVLVPSRGLLLLTLTLPLYYLKFYLDARGQVTLFHHGVVWLEFIPVWLLLLWDWGRNSPEVQAAPEES